MQFKSQYICKTSRKLHIRTDTISIIYYFSMYLPTINTNESSHIDNHLQAAIHPRQMFFLCPKVLVFNDFREELKRSEITLTVNQFMQRATKIQGHSQLNEDNKNLQRHSGPILSLLIVQLFTLAFRRTTVHKASKLLHPSSKICRQR